MIARVQEKAIHKFIVMRNCKGYENELVFLESMIST